MEEILENWPGLLVIALFFIIAMGYLVSIYLSAYLLAAKTDKIVENNRRRGIRTINIPAYDEKTTAALRSSVRESCERTRADREFGINIVFAALKMELIRDEENHRWILNDNDIAKWEILRKHISTGRDTEGKEIKN